MPPKRALTIEDEAAKTEDAKKRKTENDQKRRSNLTEEQKILSRERNSQRKRDHRTNITEQQRANKRERYAQFKRNQRSSMTEDELAQARQRDSQNRQNRLDRMTSEETTNFRGCIAIFSTNYRASTRQTNGTSNMNIAINDLLDESSVLEYNCSNLNILCNFCNANFFAGEQPQDKLFTQCCHKGKVVLEDIKVSPLIQQLMTGHHEHAKKIMDNIRSINSALAFASMGENIAPPPGYGPYCFRINGQIYHRAGALHPTNGDQRKFAHLHILDPDEAADQRMRIRENVRCHPQLMQELSTFMATNNPFAEACKMLYKVEQESIQDATANNAQPPTVSMAIVQDRKSDKRKYNAPRMKEVAVIFQNSEDEPPLESERD